MSYKDELEIIEGIISTYEEPWSNKGSAGEPEQIKLKLGPAIGDLRVGSNGKLQFCHKMIKGVPYWSDLNI